VEHQLPQERGQGRNEDVDQAMECSWDPQRREHRMVRATMHLDVWEANLDQERDRTEMGVVDFEVGSGEILGKRPGPKRDMSEVECEAVEEGVERRGRYAPDLLNPNEASSGRARQDQPSLQMPDKIRSGHATMNLCRARYRSGTGHQ
jgi:hypothetical protein